MRYVSSNCGQCELVLASVLIALILPGLFGNEITKPNLALNHGMVETTSTMEKDREETTTRDTRGSTYKTHPSVSKQDDDFWDSLISKEISNKGDEYAECDDNEEEQDTVNEKLSTTSKNTNFDDNTCRQLWIKATSFSKSCMSWRTLCKMKEGGCPIAEARGPVSIEPRVSHTICFKWEFHHIKSKLLKGLEERCAEFKNNGKKVPAAPASNTETDDGDEGKESKLIDNDESEIDDSDECDDCDDEEDEVGGADSGKDNGKTSQDSAVSPEGVQLDEKTCRDLWVKAKAFRRPCNSWRTLCKMKDGGCDLAEPLGTMGSHPEISHTIFFDQLEFHLIKSKSPKRFEERCLDLKSPEVHSEAKLNEEACEKLWLKAKAYSRPCKSWDTLCKMKQGGCEITEPLGTIGNHPQISHTIFYKHEFHLIKSSSSKGLEQRCA